MSNLFFILPKRNICNCTKSIFAFRELFEPPKPSDDYLCLEQWVQITNNYQHEEIFQIPWIGVVAFADLPDHMDQPQPQRPAS